MNNKEKQLITEEYCKEDTNYNISPGGQGGAIRKGMKHSEETKRLYSIQRMGNQNRSRKGVVLTDEHKRKLSESQKGRIFSEEHRLNLIKNHWRRKITV